VVELTAEVEIIVDAAVEPVVVEEDKTTE
jgi:hypothetical protein